MPEIGKYNSLKIVKRVDFGLYLDGEEMGEILIPNRYVPEELNLEEPLEVFLYNDSEDRIIATTEKPHAIMHDFAYLKVLAVNEYGAFLDWGLSKDLMVPFKEQRNKMEEGKSYVVFVYLDAKTERIVASAKVDSFFEEVPADLAENDKVELLIYQKTDLGYKAVINNLYSGILYENEVFKTPKIGEKTTGYIKKIRPDLKIDLSLNQLGYSKVDSISESIITALNQNNGVLNINDKSPADIIYNQFGISKKSFKMAVGKLYKQKSIIINSEGIKLISKE